VNDVYAEKLAGHPLMVTAPGRICLFGEHQDYLGLPIIAAAINLRVRLTGTPRADELCVVHLPDIGMERVFNLNADNRYANDRDYLPAAINVLRREGVRWPCGYEVTVRSSIPINSGASSSTALQVAWCAFLLAAAGDPRAQDRREIALLAHRSEVVEFAAPGGVMDHFATSFGGVLWLDTRPPYDVVQLPPSIGEFVLVDSGIPKDTTGVLAAKRQALENLGIDFSAWKASGYPPLDDVLNKLDGERRSLLEGTISNAFLTVAARELLAHGANDERLGQLLTQHHMHLSRQLGVSHPKIDALLEEARSVGATGGKINGSGCGGSFFVHAPGCGIALHNHFFKQNFRAWIVRPTSGVEIRSAKLEVVG